MGFSLCHPHLAVAIRIDLYSPSGWCFQISGVLSTATAHWGRSRLDPSLNEAGHLSSRSWTESCLVLEVHGEGGSSWGTEKSFLHLFCELINSSFIHSREAVNGHEPQGRRSGSSAAKSLNSPDSPK